MASGKTRSRALFPRLPEPGATYSKNLLIRWASILENTRVIDPTTSLSIEEILGDQAGANAVLTFNFSASVDVMYVTCRGGDGRAAINSTPTSTAGILCPDGEQIAIPIAGSAIKVYAATGTTVSVWGAR
jgi:hypothetical protein